MSHGWDQWSWELIQARRICNPALPQWDGGCIQGTLWEAYGPTDLGDAEGEIRVTWLKLILKSCLWLAHLHSSTLMTILTHTHITHTQPTTHFSSSHTNFPFLVNVVFCFILLFLLFFWVALVTKHNCSSTALHPHQVLSLVSIGAPAISSSAISLVAEILVTVLRDICTNLRFYVDLDSHVGANCL